MPQLLSKLTRSVKLEALEASDSQGAIFYFPYILDLEFSISVTYVNLVFMFLCYFSMSL